MGKSVFVVKTRAYPLGLLLHENLLEKDEIFLVFEGLPNKICFKKRAFETLSYNETPYFYADLPAQEYEMLNFSENDFSLNGLFLRVCLCQTGTIITHQCYEIENDLMVNDTKNLIGIGEYLFHENTKNDKIIFTISEKIVKDDFASFSKICPFGIIGNKGEDSFLEESKWRAWASTNFVKLEDLQCELNSEKFDFQYKKNVYIDFVLPGYFFWTMNSDEYDEKFNFIMSCIEPNLFALSIRSNCANAKHNMMKICEKFSNEEDPGLSSLDLRRYISHFKNIINKDRLYEESSNKISRKIYNKCFEDLNLESVLNDINDIVETAKIAIDGIQSERDEKVSSTLNSIAFVFTCLALISVVADVVGFVDFKGSIFDIEPRFTIVSIVLLLTVLIVFMARRKVYKC